jgi:hypothetical protein
LRRRREKDNEDVFMVSFCVLCESFAFSAYGCSALRAGVLN